MTNKKVVCFQSIPGFPWSKRAVIVRRESRPHRKKGVMYLEPRDTGLIELKPPRVMLRHREITQSIIDSYFLVYNHLGFGFSESIYAAALQHELCKAGLKVDREVNANVHYDGVVLGRVRLDMIVEGKVVVENKAGRARHEEAESQIFNYLRATNLEVGLLLNFGPRPTFKRYLCTNDRKRGLDLREGTTAPFVPDP